jgi:hypothetical protein
VCGVSISAVVLVSALNDDGCFGDGRAVALSCGRADRL